MLRSRDTPGRTEETIENPFGGGVASTAAQLQAMIQLAALVPADHVELTAAKLFDGNVSVYFTGVLYSEVPRLVPREAPMYINYPVVGAGGRDLVLECQGLFKGDITISTMTFSSADGFPTATVWDRLSVDVSWSSPKTSFKVLIDTTHPTQGQPYAIQLAFQSVAKIERCTLDLMD